MSANGTTKRDPTSVRFRVKHSDDAEVELTWGIVYTDEDFNSWSRSGNTEKAAPFTKEVDTPNDMRRCQVDFYVSSRADGKLAVKSQSKH